MARRVLNTLLGFCLFPFPLSGQQPAKTESRPASIEGFILQAATGEPINRARVLLRPSRSEEPGKAAYTGPDGRFRLAGLEPGTYRLYASRNGFLEQEHGQRKPGARGTPITLRPGQELEEVEFWLFKAAVITGRIVDEYSEPQPFVQVDALRYRHIQGNRVLFPVMVAVTNDLGEFRLFGLTPGQYYLSAVHAGRRAFVTFEQGGVRSGLRLDRANPERPTPDLTFAPTFYPGTLRLEAASPVALNPGDMLRNMNFTLHLAPTVRVRGRVINRSGSETQATQVLLMPGAGALRLFGSGQNSTRADASGQFELRGVLPGSYQVVAFSRGPKGRNAGRTPLAVDEANVDDVQVVIAPTLELSGRVTGEEQPSQTAASSLGAPNKEGEKQPSRLTVHLRPQEMVAPTGASARVGPDGLFIFSDVVRDRYRLTTSGFPTAVYLKAARLGGRDVLDAGLDLTSGAPSGQLELVISAAGARVEGVVLDEDDKPFSGSTVTLVPEQDRWRRSDLFKTTSTDQNGRFTLQGIAPGSYRLFAWEDIEPGAHQDLDFLRPFERAATHLDIKEGERHSVELEIIPATKTRFQ